jgi:hypothetical protein
MPDESRIGIEIGPNEEVRSRFQMIILSPLM